MGSYIAKSQEVASCGIVSTLAGENMRVKAEFASVDIKRIAEAILPCVNEKKQAVVEAFIKMLQTTPLLIPVEIPFPSAQGYDMAQGRYVTIDGVRYDKGEVNDNNKSRP